MSGKAVPLGLLAVAVIAIVVGNTIIDLLALVGAGTIGWRIYTYYQGKVEMLNRANLAYAGQVDDLQKEVAILRRQQIYREREMNVPSDGTQQQEAPAKSFNIPFTWRK